jgi:hypothetical protein
MKSVANPSCGLASSPAAPTSARKERRKSKGLGDTQPPDLVVDKIHVVNSIAEMLIINWREVVRHMKSLGVLRVGRDGYPSRAGMRPSASEVFAMGRPHSASGPFAGESPVPSSPTPDPGTRRNPPSSLAIPRRRPRPTPPLPSHARTMASVLSPPVEEPSPAMLERSKGDTSTPGTPRRHEIWRRTRGRGATFFESARQPGCPVASATPIKGQKVEQQVGTPSRGTKTPLKRKFYKHSVTADTAHDTREQAERQTWASEPICRTTPEPDPVMQGPARSVTSIGRGEDAPVDDTPRATAFERGRSWLSDLGSGRGSHVSAETGSPVTRPTRTTRLQSPRHGFNQTQTGSEGTHRTSHDGTRNGELAKEAGCSSERASTDSVSSSAVSRHATTFHVKRDNRPAILTSTRTMLFGPRAQPTRPTLDTAPQSTPASMAGSAVKAMAAMFESASTGPISPSSPAQSELLPPYTVDSLSMKSPRRSPKPTNEKGEQHLRWLTTRDPPALGSEGSTPDQPHTPASQHTAPNRRGSSSSKRLPRQKTPEIGRSPPDRPDTIVSTCRIEPKLATTTPRLSPSVPGTKSPPASTAGYQGHLTRRFPLVSTPEQKQGGKPETAPYTGQTIQAHVPPPFSPTPGRNAAPVSDAELALELVRLREQLRQAEQACAMWRERAERAERAERRVEKLEELDAYARVL